MKSWITFLLLLVATSQTHAALENTTCKSCHPIIFEEYQKSIHSKSSIYKDAVHKAVWDKHPAKEKGDYKCAKCHTPSDHDVMSGKSKLSDNEIQRTEPISCQQCHKIESVEKHTKANKNILTTKPKTFFAADKALKGTKVEFKEESSFFGMLTKKTGSPYHDIDYSNEGYYNGDSCMGCHSHKQNSIS
jgi:DNA-directed RNA polymerase subunit RPC12/RpoP